MSHSRVARPVPHLRVGAKCNWSFGGGTGRRNPRWSEETLSWETVVSLNWIGRSRTIEGCGAKREQLQNVWKFFLAAV